MNTLSRRRFLKISSASIVAAGAVSGVGRTVADAATAEKGIRQVPTFCDICFWKCGAVASVRDGKLWKIEGNPIDPLCHGRLCPRGTGGIGAHTDPDRLRSPLIRTNERGEEKWKEVTWDEALDYIAQRMKKIATEHGPESMAAFAHGIGGTFLKHTLKAYGAINMAAPSFAQCRGPREVGFELTFGDVVGSPERTDIENSDCLVLIGSHLGENMHNTQVQEFATAVGRGASIIVVDPRFSVAASKAKFYLPIKPGTDLALLLAWMHVLVTEKLYDADYVAKYGFGFEQFAASLTTYTPEWAFVETGIDPDTIRTTAREMARHHPATLVHPGRHVNWYGDDAQRSRAIALLNALLGSWGRKGGFYQPSSMDVPAYPYPDYPKATRAKLDNPDKKYPFASESLSTGIRDATISGLPYPVKGWLVYATNLLHALPNEAETIEAMKQLDLLVVVDVIPSETAGWADVVLPESTYLERFDDLNPEYFKQPFLGLRQPVIESPQDQKPNWWIAKKLAEKLGLGAFYPWNDIEEYLEHRVTAAGLSYPELKQKGIILGQSQPLYYEDGAPAEFYTPSGKIEFYSPQLEAAGFDPVPRYTPPAAGPPGSFRLLFGRAPMHSFSRTQSNRLLSDMMSENAVWLNHTSVTRLGLKSDDFVRLRNQDGIVSNRIKVKATERIRPDCVYMVHGFGHTSRGLRHAFGKGASDAKLVTRYQTDPLMGGTGMNVNFVTIEPEA
ncbi:MAG: molybdopterin-dependent oxidoreductase [Cephaloticoccus sp.]|nr:molybdopterin-dependent oxidoreductase [Cephaloticoccus sp.]MCF7761119.1 molybdopterin-dependent oxidoreductase [Cephaloticoccus sp.]